MARSRYLEGQLLIAMPGIGGNRFERSLVYLCAHSRSGAMGLIINKPAPLMFFSDILCQLSLPPGIEVSALPRNVLNMPVLIGGPVDQGRGFVLHSKDYFVNGTSLDVRNGIALTATTEVLTAIVQGDGPGKVLLALGYSGWTSGQLEDEIKQNVWLICEADDELVFGAAQETKYDKALHKLGVDPTRLSMESGHS